MSHTDSRSTFSPDTYASSPYHINTRNLTKPSDGEPSVNLAKELREASEFKSTINQIQRNFGSQAATDYKSVLMSTMMSVDPNALLFLNSLFESKNIGFRGQVCRNCFAYWIDPVLNNGADMKSSVKSAGFSPHSCSPKNTAAANDIKDMQVKTTKIENELINMLVLLTSACVSLYSQKPLLITEELTVPSLSELLKRGENYGLDDNLVQRKLYPNFWMEGDEANCNQFDVNLIAVGEKHWANRGISEVIRCGKSSLIMDNNELFDFLKRAKGTFGAITTDVGDSLRDFFMYISFKNNTKHTLASD